MNTTRIAAKVPATSANLGAGYDSFGIALQLYTTIEIQAANATQIEIKSPHLQSLPTDRSNLVYRAMEVVFTHAHRKMPHLHVTIDSEVPLARGLGSSAAAIVGGMCAANAWLGEPLSRELIFALATRMEGHPDNVGAALYGGLIVAVMEGDTPHHIALAPPANLTALLVIPEYELSTRAARDVLPTHVTLEDAVYNVSHASLFVAAWASARLDMLSTAMRDRLHQPYRAPLVTGLENILQEAPAHGALGAALSGAGPTILILADEMAKPHVALESFLLHTIKKSGFHSSLRWVKPAVNGVEIEVFAPI